MLMHAHSRLLPDPKPLLEAAHHALRSGSARRAWAAAVAAAMVADRLPPLRVPSLISALHAVGEDALAATLASRLDLDVLPPSDLVRTASVLTAGQSPQHAMRLVRHAMVRAPDDDGVRLAHARLSTFIGDFDAAHESLKPCLDDYQSAAFAHWQLAGLRRWTRSDNHLARLEHWLHAPQSSREQRIYAGFALHKELDDLGEHDGAWQALQLGCRIKRDSIDYDGTQAEVLIRELMATEFPRPRPADPRERPVPVFIVGLHRSGTSLLHSLLGSLPGVHAAGEIYTFSKKLRVAADCAGSVPLDLSLLSAAKGLDLPSIGKAYHREMCKRAGSATHTLDKLPSNFLLLGHILTALPGARILHLVRDPLATAFSSLRELFGSACAYSYSERELVDYVRGYQSLMAHWHQSFPGRILDVSFDRLLQNHAPILKSAMDFCGIDDHPPAQPDTRGVIVTTASAVQVRQPVAPRHRPRHEPYLKYFGALKELLPADA